MSLGVHGKLFGSKASQLLQQVNPVARLWSEARQPMPLMLESEAELLRKAGRGDDEAFGRLIQPCMDPAYRLALRILGNAQDAEDAVQDALYKAWKALPRFRGEAKFSTWLYRILWRTCMDRTRSRAPAPAEIEPVSPSQEFDPEARFEAAEERRAVEAALRRLPLPYQAVITLFYLEDLPLKEVAAILELPVGTVKTHLHRARRSLRTALAETQEGRR